MFSNIAKISKAVIILPLKMHNSYYGYTWRLLYSGVLNPRKGRLLKTLHAPFDFENSGITFLCIWAKTETLLYAGVVAHIPLLIG